MQLRVFIDDRHALKAAIHLHPVLPPGRGADRGRARTSATRIRPRTTSGPTDATGCSTSSTRGLPRWWRNTQNETLPAGTDENAAAAAKWSVAAAPPADARLRALAGVYELVRAGSASRKAEERRRASPPSPTTMHRRDASNTRSRHGPREIAAGKPDAAQAPSPSSTAKLQISQATAMRGTLLWLSTRDRSGPAHDDGRRHSRTQQRNVRRTVFMGSGRIISSSSQTVRIRPPKEGRSSMSPSWKADLDRRQALGGVFINRQQSGDVACAERLTHERLLRLQDPALDSEGDVSFPKLCLPCVLHRRRRLRDGFANNIEPFDEFPRHGKPILRRGRFLSDRGRGTA